MPGCLSFTVSFTFSCRRIQQRLPAEVLSSLASTLVKEPRTFELVRVLEKVGWIRMNKESECDKMEIFRICKVSKS